MFSKGLELLSNADAKSVMTTSGEVSSHQMKVNKWKDRTKMKDNANKFCK